MLRRAGTSVLSVKSNMVYSAQALFFLSLTTLKNIYVAMAMLIFLCLVRNKNLFGLTETPRLIRHWRAAFHTAFLSENKLDNVINRLSAPINFREGSYLKKLLC